MVQRSIGVCALLCLSGACSSSASAPADTCGFAGTYATTWTTTGGDCGDVPALDIQIDQQGSGFALALSAKATENASTFDEKTCKASFGFSFPSGVAGACASASDSISIAASFKGGAAGWTATVTGCGGVDDAGAATQSACTGTYTIAAVKL